MPLLHTADEVTLLITPEGEARHQELTPREEKGEVRLSRRGSGVQLQILVTCLPKVQIKGEVLSGRKGKCI